MQLKALIKIPKFYNLGMEYLIKKLRFRNFLVTNNPSTPLPAIKAFRRAKQRSSGRAINEYVLEELD